MSREKKSLQSTNVSGSYSKNKSDFPHLFPKRHNCGQINKTSNLQLTMAKHCNNKLQDSSKIHWVTHITPDALTKHAQSGQ